MQLKQFASGTQILNQKVEDGRTPVTITSSTSMGLYLKVAHLIDQVHTPRDTMLTRLASAISVALTKKVSQMTQ